MAYTEKEKAEITHGLNGALTLYKNGFKWCTKVREKEVNGITYHCLTGAIFAGSNILGNSPYPALRYLAQIINKVNPKIIACKLGLEGMCIVQYNDFVMGHKFDDGSDEGREHAMRILKHAITELWEGKNA